LVSAFQRKASELPPKDSKKVLKAKRKALTTAPKVMKKVKGKKNAKERSAETKGKATRKDSLEYKKGHTSPRHYGVVTIYCSCPKAKWRVQPDIGSREETGFAWTQNPKAQWQKLVKFVKSLPQPKLVH